MHLLRVLQKLIKEGMLLKFSRKEPQPRMFFLVSRVPPLFHAFITRFSPSTVQRYLDIRLLNPSHKRHVQGIYTLWIHQFIASNCRRQENGSANVSHACRAMHRYHWVLIFCLVFVVVHCCKSPFYCLLSCPVSPLCRVSRASGSEPRAALFMYHCVHAPCACAVHVHVSVFHV